MIRQQCNNGCHKWSTYTKKSWMGREYTRCKHCGHYLSVNRNVVELFGGSYEDMMNYNKSHLSRQSLKHLNKASDGRGSP